MDAKVCCVGPITVSCPSVTCHATLHIDFLSSCERRLVNSHRIFLSRLSWRSDPPLFRPRFFSSYRNVHQAKHGNKKYDNSQVKTRLENHTAFDKETSQAIRHRGGSDREGILTIDTTEQCDEVLIALTVELQTICCSKQYWKSNTAVTFTLLDVQSAALRLDASRVNGSPRTSRLIEQKGKRLALRGPLCRKQY
jgi:hypothetical protein